MSLSFKAEGYDERFFSSREVSHDESFETDASRVEQHFPLTPVLLTSVWVDSEPFFGASLVIQAGRLVLISFVARRLSLESSWISLLAIQKGRALRLPLLRPEVICEYATVAPFNEWVSLCVLASFE